jgi:hypothetical protein
MQTIAIKEASTTKVDAVEGALRQNFLPKTRQIQPRSQTENLRQK